MKELRDLDLNLLKLLQVVVETRNTHHAANKLGISQTSVSRGLAKLRETFGDQIFIRKAHGVEPSELAEKLAEAADEMFTPLIKVVESYQNFDPQQFTGEVSIAMNIFLLEQYGDGIFSELRSVLPNANFKLVYWQEQSLSDMLNGQVDYMLHFAQFPLPQEIYQHKLKEIKLSLIARKNHPVLSNGSAWEDIHHLPITRILVDGINSKRAPVEELYLAKGYKANIVLSTHSLRVLLSKLKNSDAFSFGSTFMTENEPELSYYPLPVIPKGMRTIQINGGYLQSKRGFPLNQLLHQTMQRYFDQVVQPDK
ncbi:LysR family transcriptional regulator [Vibrio sp. 10N.261.46.E12]|uniref:LysR family transcriptional regulator n=1 Tax=unclassified Vibrio TaxID=2614977 RepID=UPI00097875E9|nr:MULTISPECIES: LysR family transcriptional regulator [unclassified Vibrio]OMO34807.1 transcriptional regulator [Vibrio sp. 10N.261.45.E1]PMJ33810.1 transcriptional regulator [Vibrio sp. 10N.286.45.B6]PML86420.1 transcriptional regulator [Vibrio sp. 10N.261.49.E11]PMM68070.1 transcriptional regulator [Vibrio sp. 10N.261.46.F12]PMM90481.1 transcriptional regulator [Vibrio sp. 10N.261.46.E8]